MSRLKRCLLLILVTASAAGQQPPPPKPSELVAGKLVHVEPMPANLDQWVLEYLRGWGKYKLTGDPEGVDLIFRVPPRERPRGFDARTGLPHPPEEPREPVALSISVVDWVTGETLWRADLLDRKPKKNEPDPPAGPHTRIFARGLKTEQIAEKLVAKLREYVAELEKSSRQ